MSNDKMADAYSETQDVIRVINQLLEHLRATDDRGTPLVYGTEHALKRVKDVLERERDYQVSQFN